MQLRAGFLLATLLPTLLATIPFSALAQGGPEQTVQLASTVLGDSMALPAKRIPQSLLAKARAVAIIPNVVKGGFVIGVRHGRGVVLVRDDTGRWTPPMFATLTGGSVGWQAGLQATDVILVFMTRRSVNGLMNGKFTIGADAAAAAGPLGRQAAAATDARLQAEILSYSRSRGLFAGVSLDGSVLQLDHLAGSAYYRAPVVSASGQVLQSRESIPSSAVQLVEQLSRYSGAPGMAVSSTAVVTKASDPVDRGAEAVRQRLSFSWQRLAGLLDSNWQSYLSPVLSSPTDSGSTEFLRERLRRFDAVLADQKYRELANHGTFKETHQLLRDYLNLNEAANPSKLTLPPPPAAARARY